VIPFSLPEEVNPVNLVRAVVSGIDIAPKTTEWLLSGGDEVQNLLIATLPPVGENLSVVWESKEIESGEV
jgi:hypothetical protein